MPVLTDETLVFKLCFPKKFFLLQQLQNPSIRCFPLWLSVLQFPNIKTFASFTEPLGPMLLPIFD